MNWTERLRKFEEEEEQTKKLLEQSGEQAAETNVDKLDDAMQLFEKPGRHLPVTLHVTSIILLV